MADSGILVFGNDRWMTRDATAFRFWLPLSEPIGLPDGFQRPVLEEPSHHEVVGLMQEGYHEMSMWLVGSVCCRQVRVERSALQFRHMDAAFDAQRASVPRPSEFTSESAPHGAGSSADSVPVSVLEVVTYGWDAEQDSDAFDHALNLAQQLLRRTRLANRRPMQLPTRETLPPLIPMVSHGPVAEPHEWTVGGAVFAPNPNLHGITEAEPLTEEMLSDLRPFSKGATSGLLPTEPLDLLLEAQTELDRNGNYRAAVLAAATAAESALDLLLATLVWEEGKSPRQAASVLGGKEFLKRVRREFPSRLGGTWDSSTPGAIRTWEYDCHRLRHRVIHRGHRPSYREAESAVRAVGDLTKFITDRLVASAKKYPRVLAKWVDSDRRPTRVNERIAELADSEASWEQMFEGWMASATSMVFPELTTPDVSQAVLAVVVTASDPLAGYWVAIDEQNGLAIEASPVGVNAAQQVSLRRAADGRSTDLPFFASVEVVEEPVVVGSWAPVHELVPGISPLHPTRTFGLRDAPASRPLTLDETG